MTMLLAHQGGWDEILFVLLPIGLFAGLLALANRRAALEQAERGDADDRDEAPGGDAAGQVDGDHPGGPPGSG